MKELIERLNAPEKEQRLAALREIVEKETEKPEKRHNDANNHIHTIYSFSPYSPTKAAYMAYLSGLTSAGIMDHDSLSGCDEFRKACRILGIGATCGVEVRVKFDKGFGNMNHPDQANCFYMAAHGVPAQNVDKFNAYLEPFRQKRYERDEKMCRLISEKFGKFGIELDFERDVLPISEAKDGGSVTERHLLFALAGKLAERFGRSEELIAFLTEDLGLAVSGKVRAYLLDPENPHFLYDLLGVLKADTGFFYIDADEELPTAEDFVKKAHEFGAITAYAYLGDVGESVTGDKKAQKFEDAFLPELIAELKKLGILAIAYMPTRNTPEQLERLRALCRENELFEISGEDINSSRQIFACKALAKPEFANLIDATWALIGHEAISTEKGEEYGMFAPRTVAEEPDLYKRVKKYALIGAKTI
ncbi:MAG: PHP domain-containing protein [Ruminococcaceae bacterium]|nr:PHP domain-containing protein [Oscillospiraceae bacterium]